MAEKLADYLMELGIKVHYLHSEIDTLERIGILRDLRLGVFDVVVGINLLREGLDLPEVSLIAILDADKEGFLRSETSLIQTIGRAARHVEGRVIMYADTMTDSMRRAIDETNRRRAKQRAYNEAHGIQPVGIFKAVRDLTDQLSIKAVAEPQTEYRVKGAPGLPKSDLQRVVSELEKQMKEAAKNLEFEKPPYFATRSSSCVQFWQKNPNCLPGRRCAFSRGRNEQYGISRNRGLLYKDRFSGSVNDNRPTVQLGELYKGIYHHHIELGASIPLQLFQDFMIT